MPTQPKIVQVDIRPERLGRRAKVDLGLCGSTGATVVDTCGQRYSADQVVVCSGRDAQFLFSELLAQSALQLCKLQMLATYPLPQVQLPGSVLTGLSSRRYHAFHSALLLRSCKPSPWTLSCGTEAFTSCLSRRSLALLLSETRTSTPTSRRPTSSTSTIPTNSTS